MKASAAVTEPARLMPTLRRCLGQAGAAPEEKEEEGSFDCVPANGAGTSLRMTVRRRWRHTEITGQRGSSRWGLRRWKGLWAKRRCDAYMNACSECWRWRVSRSIRDCREGVGIGGWGSSDEDGKKRRLASLAC